MTRKMILIAGVASLTLTPAMAGKPDRADGGGGGGGKDRQQQQIRPQSGGGGGGGQQARQERPQRIERQQRVERQMQRPEQPQRMERQMQRAERPQRMERQQQRAERPQRMERQQQRAERPQRMERQQQRAERPQRLERQQQRAERQLQRRERPQHADRKFQRQERPQRAERQQQRLDRQSQRQEGPQRFDRKQQRAERQQQRVDRRGPNRPFAPRLNDEQRSFDDAQTVRFDGRGYRPIAPVFAGRDMRRMKPFKAKFDDRNYASIGDRYDNGDNWAPVPSFYGSRFADNNDYYYRYNDDYGYAYQINRRTNLIGASYPLFGGYGIGDPWPQTYYSSYVPAGYRDYYYDTPDYYYRNDGYGIYQVDAGSQLITALVSLVLGQNYGVGQVLPDSYSTYNVPLDYRDRYADSDDSWYRYGDGFIYEVEPDTRRVSARYPLYADDYYVGERWPVAYPDYNVPYAYRDEYADSPQYHYRYADGGIYQVDPTNQLILALAALVTGDQFAVGQPMPSGYDIYNVPVDYRDRWADSDEEYYRYANGYVYRVDSDSDRIQEAFPAYS